jgi:glycosyltransferase involved in cell wall biosynthesis
LNVLFPTNVGDPRKRFGLARAAEETARQRGIPVEIHQLRDITHNEVPIWLNASDVLLLTSLHEGSPNVVKEALACNLPVISVDVGDVGERLNGIDGCHLASPDPNHLATKLSLVYFGSRTVAGRVRMNELSLERIAVKLKQVYEGIVRSPTSEEVTSGSAPDQSMNDPDVSRGGRWLRH